jgi:probable rRNA maturation factor
MLEIINQTTQIIDEKIFVNLAQEILLGEGKDETSEVSLTLCDGEQIQKLNKQYRGNNKKTDVLSFEMDIPGVPMLGDIIIDIEVADAQKGIKSLSYELQVLFIHGLLHLLGHDHIKTKDKEIMQFKEKKYRKYIKGD